MQLKPADILTHLTAALVIILKQVPGVGMFIDYKDRLKAARQARQIFNQMDDMKQRTPHYRTHVAKTTCEALASMMVIKCAITLR